MKPKFIYISLVGTSILKNTIQRLDKWKDKYNDINTWHNMPLEDPRNIYPQGFLCKLRELEQLLYIELLEKSLALGVVASAESTGLVKMSSLLMHDRKDVEVVLYPTSSCASVLSAELNKTLLEKLGFSRVRIELLEKLGKLESFEEGLVELLDKVVEEVLNARKNGIPVYTNATPGFKAESSFLVIASLLAGANGAVYIHETFDNPIFIPLIPVSINEEFRRVVKSLGEKIPGEAWSSIDLEVRRELIERGIVLHKEGYYVIRPWIKTLVEKIVNSQSL